MPTKSIQLSANTSVQPSAELNAIPRGINILNAIRANASTAYQERVPVATQNNINDVGNPIINYQSVQNEFLDNLVNRIALVIITSRSYTNPLSRFKKGLLSLGETVEEIFVNIIKAEPYYRVDAEGKTACQDEFEQRIPDVRAAFHTRNRQDKYPVTISNDDLRAAFLSYQGVEDLVSKIIEAVYTSDQYDEFLLMKNIFFEAGTRGALYPVTVQDPRTSESTAKAFARMTRGTARTLTFMSDKYNLMGVTTHTPVDEQVIFILPEVEAAMDVEALAYAFNMDKVDFMGRVIVVDDFGGLEKEGVVAIAVDEDWFMVFDNYFSMTEKYVASRLYWNYFLHHWQTLSYSPFKNAIAYTTTAPTVTGVTVTPETQTLSTSGGIVTFTASVVGTGLVSPNVTWTVSGGTGVTLKEDEDKHSVTVTVPAGQTAGTITVVANSITDDTKSATGTITITA